MTDLTPTKYEENLDTEIHPAMVVDKKRLQNLTVKALILLLVFMVGGVGGFLVGSRMTHTAPSRSAAESQTEAMILMQEVNPPEGYQIPAVFGDVGQQLVASGAIDLEKFTSLYLQQGKPLTDEQLTILTKDSNTQVIINPVNAYFLLNFFWALGLTNENPILTEGPMVANGREKVGGFASTGGWTLGARDSGELYASTNIVSLSEEQQARLLEVASGVYRPCCNNPTHFPDCNHGMAMLGLLELMASQNATADEMFATAKYVNAFWYPQQFLELALAFKASQQEDFTNADARMVVSKQVASISGFQSVHNWLAQNGLLEQAPSSGGSCGVQ